MLFRLLILVYYWLDKKTDCDTTIGEIGKKITDHGHGNKFITTQEFGRLMADNFASKLKQVNLTSKNHIADFVKKTYFNDKQKIK